MIALSAVVVYFGVRSYFEGDVISRRGFVESENIYVAEQFWSDKGKLLFYRYYTFVDDDSGTRRPTFTKDPWKIVHVRSRTDGPGWAMYGREFPGLSNRWHGFNIGRDQFIRRTWRPELGPPGKSPNATQTTGVWFVSAPHWFVALVLGIWPAFSTAHWFKRRRRMKRGHCVQCNYDLRAGQDKCPECGTPIPSGSPASNPAPSAEIKSP